VVLASIVLNRFDRRIYLAWIAPALALTASAALIALGSSARTVVVPTTTTMQLVEVSPERGDIRLRGVAGAYFPRPSSHDVTGSDCVLQPVNSLFDSTNRIVWTDQNRWHLENTTLPAGVTLAHCSWYLDAQRRPVANATLDANGIVGQLELPRFDDPRDAVLISPGAAQLSVEISSDGSFRTGPDRMLEKNQFIAAGLIGEDARRHQEVYRELLAGSAQNSGSLNSNRKQPMLLFWAMSSELPINFGPTPRHVGEALVAVPLNIQRPEEGATITIPAALIPFATTAGPDGTRITSAFSSVDNSWVDNLVSEARITLRFQFPSNLLPLQLERATFHAEVTAPSREITIAGWNAAQRIKLTSAQSPVDRHLIVPIEDPETLCLDERGGLRLNIDVGPHPSKAEKDVARVGWHIDRVWLDARAALSPSSRDTQQPR
jgi:hypothetical protein